MKRFLTLLLISFFGISLSASATVKKTAVPDFAFPKTVISQSESAIKQAISKGNETEAIRAVMNYSIAQSSIGSDNWQKAIDKIVATEKLLKKPQSKAVMNLLLATLYNSIYSANNYVYNQRKLPLEPLSADYREWSGEQFRRVISDLCDKSLKDITSLQASPLNEYESIIEIAKESQVYFPTLYDFVAHRVIALRSGLSPFSSCIGLLSLTPRTVFMINPGFTPASQEAQKILDIYAALLSFHKNRPAPEIYCDIQRINFVYGNLYGNLTEKGQSTRIKLLLDLYTDYKNSEYSGNVLIALDGVYNDYYGEDYSLAEEKNFLTDKKMFAMVENNLRLFPNFPLNGCLENIRKSLSSKSINLVSPSVVSTDKSFNIRIESKNTQKLTVDIYNVTSISSSDRNWIKLSDLAVLKPIRSVSVEIKGKSVPFSADTILPVSLPEYGFYAIVPRENGKKNSRNTVQTTRCTNLAGSLINSRKSPELFVVNPLTGAPVDKASIKFKAENNRRNGKASAKDLGVTDASGFLTLGDLASGMLQPVKGKDMAASSIYYWKSGHDTDEWRYSGNVYTDLAIYQPGDTVKWCGIIYQMREFANRIASGDEVSAILYNANSVAVDTIKSVTDDWGRIDGTFLIPQGELTGSYSITLRDNKNGHIAFRRFMVSDYKMPTFHIALDTPASGVPAEGDVTLTGKAVTYSGIPVANAAVKAVIAVSTGRWWYRSNEVEFCSLSDTTDSDGSFKMILKKDAIKNSPAPEGLFSANISVTSMSGESQQQSETFNVGSRYSIVSSLPAYIEVSRPVDLSSYFKVISSEGKTVECGLSYTLYNETDAKPIISGPISSSIDWNKIHGDEYRLIVKSTELPADSLTIDNFIIYRDNDDYSPSNNVLWYPGKNALTVNGNKTDIKVFAKENDTHTLYYLESRGNCIERKWLKLKKGVNEIRINLPEKTESASLNLSAVKDFMTSNIRIDIEVADSRQKLNFLTESFRDRLIPGQEETWTFRTLDIDSVGTRSAVVLDMYNQALDVLAAPSWEIGFNTSYVSPLHVSAPSFGYNHSGFSSDRYDWSKCIDIVTPQLQTYGMTFSPVTKYRATMLYGSVSGLKLSEDKVANEMAAPMVKEESALDEVVVTGYGSMRKSALTGAAVKESDEIEEEDSGDMPITDISEKESFEYRETNTPIAFFAPKLTTDENGKLTYSFTVPNANTTWSFNALAYDRNLISTSFHKEILANKPIMVQPNLPRFLRTGDEVSISSTVMNNTDVQQGVKVLAELFDPLTNKVFSTLLDSTLVLSANEDKTVQVALTAPENSPFIGIRVKATNGNFSDGEQALIPILPASSPVIETTPFYISPDSSLFSMKLPDYPADSRITLQYCDNPTWYVVTALPGISAKEARTSPDAAAAIFSAAVADGILQTYPQVRIALKEWLQSDKSDSTLVSLLERNADLKTFMLQATPWMLDSRSDTERMQRLALLFDKKNIRQTYDKNIALLKKLQRSNGGLAWINQYDKSSEWATQQTLSILGRLNQLGFLPADKTLHSIISSALKYIQTENEKTYRKYPKSDFTDYVMLLDYWPDFKPSLTSTSIISSTVSRYVSTWKKKSLIDKTTAALLFYRHGYKPLASQVLASLRQFAETSPSKGMWWPILDDFAGGTMTQLRLTSQALQAFHLINPDGKEVDAIRQWLILQKEARNWGNSESASDVAVSILLTSPKWVSAAAPAKVMIGSAEIKPSHVEETLGYFRTDISSMKPSGSTLTVDKSDMTPAWGAVYSQSTQTMKDIRPASCDAVSIEKRIYRQIGDKWEKAENLSVGDRVRIELLIRSSRAMDYVAISDERAACFEPVEQLPSPIFSEGLCFYRENNDETTNIFISNMPKGTYLLSYEMWVNNAGTFSSGIATIQSQYATQLTAHSAGSIINAYGL